MGGDPPAAAHSSESRLVRESLIELAEAEVVMEAVAVAAPGGDCAEGGGVWKEWEEPEGRALPADGVADTSAEMYFSCSTLADVVSLEPPAIGNTQACQHLALISETTHSISLNFQQCHVS